VLVVLMLMQRSWRCLCLYSGRGGACACVCCGRGGACAYIAVVAVVVAVLVLI